MLFLGRYIPLLPRCVKRMITVEGEFNKPPETVITLHPNPKKKEGDVFR